MPPPVQDCQIVICIFPDDHDVTSGNLCIKGRFGRIYLHSYVGSAHGLVVDRRRPAAAEC